MSWLTDLLTLLQTATAPAPITPGDAGIGGRVGGDSGGVLPGGGANAGGGAQNAPGGGSVTPGGYYEPLLTSANRNTPTLGSIWEQIVAGAPIVGIYAFLALLILIGVVGLVVSSGAGQAAIGAATGEVGAAAAGVGRAAGRRLVRQKPPPKS